jgi:two-component system chemotaxis response regulator CheY
MHALVIDDSRAMRAILGKMLKELGFEIVEASHGREGLERLKQIAMPDLALVDWNMPEMNGLEFVQAVRADHAYDTMRVMMVSTESTLGAMTTALAAGANEYVMKPFTKDVILEKLALIGIEP